MIQRCPDMFHPPPRRESSEAGRDEPEPIIHGDGIGYTPAGKQGGEESDDHLGGDGSSREHLRPFGLGGREGSHQEKALVLWDAVEFSTNVHLYVGPWCWRPRQRL